MTTKHVFMRMAVYGTVLGAVDAVSGRAFGASPNPNFLLLLLASAWAGFTFGANRHGFRMAALGGLTFFAGYIGTFAELAHVLVGWNNSVPWRTSPGEIGWFAVAASAVAALFRAAGARARAASDATGNSRGLTQ